MSQKRQNVPLVETLVDKHPEQIEHRHTKTQRNAQHPTNSTNLRYCCKVKGVQRRLTI